MTPLPHELVAWRLNKKRYANTWDSGEGAFKHGGRWNSKGVRAVYCSIDPATAILELAVNDGFETLDEVPHVLTALDITDHADVYIVESAAVPNANWLRPGIPSAGMQRFGDDLLNHHKFILIPSVVSTHSWNLLFVATAAAGAYSVRLQEDFALDTRLHPPASR